MPSSRNFITTYINVVKGSQIAALKSSKRVVLNKKYMAAHHWAFQNMSMPNIARKSKQYKTNPILLHGRGPLSTPLLWVVIIPKSQFEFFPVAILFTVFKMISLKQLFTLTLGLGAFTTTFYSIGKLMWFLSTPSQIKLQYTWVLNLMDNLSRLEIALLPLTIDMILIVLFIMQHSLMRARVLKAFWAKIGLATAERSLYNLATAGTLIVSKSSYWQFLYVNNKKKTVPQTVSIKTLANNSVFYFVANRCWATAHYLVDICFGARLCLDHCVRWQYSHGLAGANWSETSILRHQ